MSYKIKHYIFYTLMGENVYLTYVSWAKAILFSFFTGKFSPKIKIKNQDFGGFQLSKKEGEIFLVKVAIFL